MKEAPINNSKKEAIRYLALGDSYTKGQSVPYELNFPNQLSDSLRKRGKVVDKTEIVAETGWTTSNLKQAIAQAKPNSNFNFVTLLIGVNNFYQNKDSNLYIREFEELLLDAIGFAGGRSKNVMVISIPDYGYSPFGQSKSPEKISAQTDQYNRIAQDIASSYSVEFVDITEISRNYDARLIASDGLHPSAYQYKLWVAKILASADF